VDGGVIPPPAEARCLHVVFLVRSFGFPHGTASTNRVRLLGRALAEQGADVKVMCLRVSELPGDVRNTRARGAHDGIRFLYTTGTTTRSSSFFVRRYRETRGFVAGVRELLRLRRTGQLSAVCLNDHVSQWYPSVWLLRRLLAARGIPVVVQLNELPRRIPRRPATLSRALSHLDSVDGVIAISGWLSGWARDEARRIGKQVLIADVPIVVDARETPVAAPPERPPTEFVYSASWVYSADRRFLLRAMARVWRSRPEASLTVLGTGPDELAELACAEGLADAVAEGRVTALGYVTRPQLLARLRGAAALLVPLHDDAVSQARFPTKMGEYLASGRPVVTAQVGDIGRYLYDGETAFVAQTPDEHAFAAKMLEVLADPVRATAVGRAGRRVAEERFQYDLYGEALATLFRRLAEPPATSS